MPLYEYHCSKCGHAQEVLLPIREMTDTRECPECGYIAIKVINFGGHIQLEDAPWIREAAAELSDPVPGGQVTPTRSGLREHLERTGTRHKETSVRGRWMV